MNDPTYPLTNEQLATAINYAANQVNNVGLGVANITFDQFKDQLSELLKIQLVRAKLQPGE